MNAPDLAPSLLADAAPIASGRPLLDVRGLTVSFGGKEVVHGVDFKLASGEKLALVGESGSGKTVTALSLLRLALNADLSGSAVLHDPISGQNGKEPRKNGLDLLSISEHAIRGVRGREIAMIFQEPMTALNPLFTVGDQVAEVIELKQGLTKRQAWQSAIEALAATGIPEPARRADSYPHQLSGGQRQRAMIAMALACRPRLLLADEPTTALDVTLRVQILDLLSDLQRQTGMAILLITHDLNLVRRFADRIAVMEHGHLVEEGTVPEVFDNPQHPYTQKLIDSRPERDASVDAIARQYGHDAPTVSGRGVRVTYPVPLAGIKGWFKKGRFTAVEGADFTLAPGRTLGVVGESGSGKSTLAAAALGLVPHTGELAIGKEAWGPSAAANKSLRRVVQVVFQDPFSSLSPRMTVEEIVGEGLLVHAPELDKEARRAQVLTALSDVGLSESQFPGLLRRYPHEFSGGQRQRLAVARALIVSPRVLVLDEPTSALDVTIQKQVLKLLQRLQREKGLSYLLITHDVDVIRAMAHDVMVMKDGKILEAGPVDAVLNDPVDPYTRRLVAAAS